MHDRHQKLVHELSYQLQEAAKLGKKIKFFHHGSNTTRGADESYTYIDVSALDEVIEVNKEEKFVLTEPNVPMDDLVKETLKQGLLPPVVMEFPGITVGGGIEGAALESSSFKNGQFSDSCLEYEVILADGKVLTISPKQHADLFYGMHGSYGSLCLLTKVKLRLVPAKKYVRTTYTPYSDYEELLQAMQKAFGSSDYVEAITYSPNKSVLIIGTQTDECQEPVQTFTKASDMWFYAHIDTVTANGKWSETVPILDHLFRYNLGAFWMGEYIYTISHVPHNKFTNWFFHPFFNTRKLFECLHEFNIGHAFFIQDLYIPFDSTKEFIQFSHKETGIYPLWLCPVKSTQKMEKLSPHYNDTDMMIDVGVWGRNKKFIADPIGMNKRCENKIQELNGRKMLYAQQHYTEEEFWKVYDKSWYNTLRKKYGATHSFPDVYEKTKDRGNNNATPWKGFWKTLFSALRGKNLNS